MIILKQIDKTPIVAVKTDVESCNYLVLAINKAKCVNMFLSVAQMLTTEDNCSQAITLK